MDDVTTWTAVASTTTAALALVIAVIPMLRQWLYRPRLRLVAGLEEPHQRGPVPMQNTSVPSWWLRLEVHNDGRGPAERIAVVVDRWWEYSADEGEWVVHRIDPFELGWSSRPRADPSDWTTYSSQISLPSGGRALLNVAVQDEHGLRVLPQDQNYRGFSTKVDDVAEEQRLELLISGQGFRSVRRVVAFRSLENNPQDAGFRIWELSEPPAESAS